MLKIASRHFFCGHPLSTCSVCLSVCLSVNLRAYQSTCLSFFASLSFCLPSLLLFYSVSSYLPYFQCICWSVSVCHPDNLSVKLFVFLISYLSFFGVFFLFFFLCLSVCLYLHPFSCLSVFLSFFYFFFRFYLSFPYLLFPPRYSFALLYPLLCRS